MNMFLFIKVVIIFILFNKNKAAIVNLIIDDYMTLVPSNIIFVTAAPDERIFIHCEDTNFYQFNSNLTFVRSFTLQNISFIEMTFYNNTYAIFIQKIRTKYGWLNIEDVNPLTNFKIFMLPSRGLEYIKYCNISIINNVQYIVIYTTFKSFYHILSSNAAFYNVLSFLNLESIKMINNSIFYWQSYSMWKQNNFFLDTISQQFIHINKIIFDQAVGDNYIYQDQNKQVYVYDLKNKIKHKVNIGILNQKLINIFDIGQSLSFVSQSFIYQVVFIQNQYRSINANQINLSNFPQLIDIKTTNQHFAYIPGAKRNNLYPIKECPSHQYWKMGQCKDFEFCRITKSFNKMTNQCQSNIQYQNLDIFLNYTNQINKIPTVKVIFTLLSPLFFFIEDYWLYIYHLKQEKQPLYLFFYEIFVYGNQKLLPSFISQQQINFLSSHVKNESQKYQKYTPSQILNLEKQSTYFSKKIFQMIQWSWHISFYIFFCFYLLKLLVSFIKKRIKNHTIKKILSFLMKSLEQKSSLIMFLFNCLESNIIYLCFYGTLQLKNLIWFTKNDKINFYLTISVVFIVIIYGFLIDLSVNKTRLRQLYKLYNQRNVNNKGTILRTFFFGLKNAYQGILHALFLGKIIFLMPSLILTKLIVIYGCVKNKKCFESICLYYFNLIYFGCGIFMDIYLFYSYVIRNYLKIEDIDGQICFYIQISIIIVFMVLILSKILTLVIIGTCKAIISKFQRNFDIKRQIISKKQLNNKFQIKIQQVNQIENQDYSIIKKGKVQNFLKNKLKKNKISTKKQIKTNCNLADKQNKNKKQNIKNKQIQLLKKSLFNIKQEKLQYKNKIGIYRNLKIKTKRSVNNFKNNKTSSNL